MATITVDHTRQLEDGRQVAFFTLTDDNGNTYNWHGNVPQGEDPQAYFESIIDKVLLLIRRREYPDMPPEIQTLEEAEKWIADGCKIKVQVGVDENGEPVYEERVAEKKEFKNTW